MTFREKIVAIVCLISTISFFSVNIGNAQFFSDFFNSEDEDEMFMDEGDVFMEEEELEGWEKSVSQLLEFFVIVGVESSDFGENNSGAFSSEYSMIRDEVLTDVERVRANTKRLGELISYQSQLLSSYSASGVWNGDQNADQYCRDNVILCKYLPYTFDQIKWD